LADSAGKEQGGEWFGRLVTGDHRAFAEFVDKYKESVFLCCRTLGLRNDEAEDVAGETFLAAYKALSRYKGQAELSTWLWRIAYHKGISFIRKKGRRIELLTEFSERFVDEKNGRPGAGIEAEEQAEVVWTAVKCLPRLWAVAVVLFYRQGKSVKEIAGIMRKRENTIKTYLFRARKELKKILVGILGEDIDVV